MMQQKHAYEKAHDNYDSYRGQVTDYLKSSDWAAKSTDKKICSVGGQELEIQTHKLQKIPSASWTAEQYDKMFQAVMKKVVENPADFLTASELEKMGMSSMVERAELNVYTFKEVVRKR